jgi:hypothetical protein
MTETVGKSNRTPGKHAALDKYLGKQAGVISRRYASHKVWFLDCTAGDGQAENFDRQTSPGIMLRHAEWLKAKGIDAEVLLYERSQTNAQRLSDKVGNRAQVHHESSQDILPFWGKNDLLFVSNDPNTVNDWALPDALEFAPPLTTVFSTLGCNVGGLKRLPIDQRRQWYMQMQRQARLLQEWHDMMLVMLVNDASQWAYAVNSADKWRTEVSEIFRKSFDAVGYPTDRIWARQDRNKFRDAQNRLFLTKKEYEDGNITL